MTQRMWWSQWVWIVVLAIILGGCAGMQAAQTKSKEDLLAAAGFQVRIPDTSAKMAKLQKMPQRKIVAHTRNGKTYYTYADAVNNRLYVGNQAAYQQYQQMAAAERIAQEQLMAAQMYEEASMDWQMWGPWDPWW